MKTKDIRTKILRLFPESVQTQLQPLIDTLITAANQDGVLQGRNEGAAMVEMMVLGGDGIDQAQLASIVETLRNHK